MNEIVKAEILWTRVCPLKCSYCAMSDGRTNSQSLTFWEDTARQLSDLNCGFAAFYGAEPLADKESFQKLGQTLSCFYKEGIDTTLITSGAVKDFRHKLEYLHHHDLYSLTMSCDILPLDASSGAKTKNAIDNLLWFKELNNVRNVANVVTLTKWNYALLPEHIAKMSDLGIWTFFDLIHDDRGQSGSKCRHTDTTSELMFNGYHYENLGRVLEKVESMKKEGYLCNSSIPFIELLKENDFQHIKNYDWNCAKYDEFPSWISIDCDGVVHPCDDFHVSDVRFMADKISEQFDEFRNTYKKIVCEKCPGCLWNTHIDARFIKAGVLPGYGIDTKVGG